MNVNIKENPQMNSNDVIIECKQSNVEIENAAEVLRIGGSTIIGSIDNIKYVVKTVDILYFESVDKNGFFYTADNVYHTELRLYEVEERFKAHHFIRISKSMVLNILNIDEISPFIAGKLRLRLTNGEYIIVSRQYSQNIKHVLGI